MNTRRTTVDLIYNGAAVSAQIAPYNTDFPIPTRPAVRPTAWTFRSMTVGASGP